MRTLLSLLPKPSRYIGIEEGSVNKQHRPVDLRVALAFPDMYEVGMSYLGQKILYGILNERENWWAERVFTPCREAGALLREHGIPLASLESDTPLAEFDAIGFSITHELCYTNVLYMLDLAGIPLRSAGRDTPQPGGKPWPLIIAGGGCTLAAEPMAPFIDVMLLGEGEECLVEVADVLERERRANASRLDTLHKLSHIPGVYIPEFFTENTDRSGTSTSRGTPWVTPLYPHHTGAVRRVIADMDTAAYPTRQPIPFRAVHNRLALEIGRGCTRGCRFCQAGSIYRPARERKVDTLQNLLQGCLTSTGFDDVSFLSLSTGDFSALKELFMGTVERCAFEQVSVSLPSLRVGSIDDSIMERMAGIRRTGATLAPEAGSQRLRDVINKGITEEELILHIQKLFEHGWQQVKLYFMIGLPTETDEDLLAILDLCRKARDAAGPGIKRLQITAALSPFVPKPHTPFQWEAQISLAEMRRRVGLLLHAVKQEKRIKLRWHEPEMSLLEGVFSRGDRRLAPVVESAYRAGAIFSSWMDNFSLDPWHAALAENGLTVEDFTRERAREEALPWDHLHSGLSREFFLRERERALSEKTTSDCRYTTCHLCGACDTKAGPSLLAPPAPEGYANRLNQPQRDQEAHTANLDEYGRVVVKNAPEGGAPGAQNQSGAKNLPPALAGHLTAKAVHLRFWYSRAGAAVYLSQLELQDIFDRAMRRARLPLSFSQGFHPLPLVSFGRALPVGVASDCEWFSIYLGEKRPLQATLDAMNQGLPRGIRLLSVEEIPLKIKGTDAPLETYTIEPLMDAEKTAAFYAAWERVRESRSIPWSRETKKGIRELDARAFFTDIVIDPEQGCTLCFDWTSRYVSPVALCTTALAAVGFDAALPEFVLTKRSQQG